MKINRFLKQFNWRFVLVRMMVNALALAITAAVTPKIYFVDKSIVSWLLVTLMLGVLNALLKPILQFLTLQFIFVTYGLVIVLVNALILWLLSLLFPARFAVDNLWWALVGGLVLGLLSSFLESLLGLTMPIVPEEAVELRRELEQQARQADWLAGGGREAGPEDQAGAVAAPAVEARTAAGAALPGPGGGTIAGPKAGGVAEFAVEPSPPGPDEGPAPPSPVEAEPFGPEVASPASTGGPVGPETAPEPREPETEDGS